MRHSKHLILALTALTFISCGQGISLPGGFEIPGIPYAPPSRPGTTPTTIQPTTPAVQKPATQKSNPWGVVKCNHVGERESWSSNVRAFLLAHTNPSGKEFSCTADYNGGFFISGRISFSGSKLDLNDLYRSYELKAGQSSWINYQIYDIQNVNVTADKPDLGMNLEYGTAYNGNFNMTFSDGSGKIKMENGRIIHDAASNLYFKADISFENTLCKDLNTQQKQPCNVRGSLGSFVIDACMFFQC